MGGMFDDPEAGPVARYSELLRWREMRMSNDLFSHMLMYREQKKELQETLRKAGVLARDISGRTLQELRLMAASLRIEA